MMLDPNVEYNSSNAGRINHTLVIETFWVDICCPKHWSTIIFSSLYLGCEKVLGQDKPRPVPDFANTK